MRLTKLILAAIIALGIIAKLIHWVWKNYAGKEAKIRRIKEELEKIRKEMRQALCEGRGDDYSRLLDKRSELLGKLRDLHQ